MLSVLRRTPDCVLDELPLMSLRARDLAGQERNPVID